MLDRQFLSDQEGWRLIVILLDIKTEIAGSLNAHIAEIVRM